jgi:hypothetical protein
MHFSLVNTFVSLLAFGKVLSTARAYPSQPSTLLDYAILLQDNELSERDAEENAIEKRATIPPLTNWGQGPGTTWTGFVKEPANSQWTDDTIDTYAFNAWRATQSSLQPPPVLVAALWVPGAGVYLGSIPHGTNGANNAEVQVLMDGRIRAEAPILWQQVKTRTYKNTSKWHAEDMAMYVYEREERPTGTQYPANSYIMTWGQYDGRDKSGPKPPCDLKANGDGIDPPCDRVLRNLRISSGC